MAYIGNDLRSNEDYKIIDDISSGFNGSATSFALQVGGATPVPFPKFEQQLLISVNGVIQEPDPTGSAGFKLSGTNIVFSSAPTNGHAFFGVIYAGADYVNAGGTFPDGSINFPSITFSADTNTGFTRTASGTVALISDGTKVAQFPTSQGSSGQALITDGAGNLSFGVPTAAFTDITLADSIIHSGDTNTKIRFPATDTATIETSGSERLRVDSSGRLNIGTDLSDSTMSSKAGLVNIHTTNTGTHNSLTVFWDHNNQTTDIEQRIQFALGDDASDDNYQNAGYIAIGKADTWQGNSNRSSYLSFATSDAATQAERIRINASGNVGIGTASPAHKLHIDGASNDPFLLLQRSGAGDSAVDLGGVQMKNSTNVLADMRARSVDINDGVLKFSTMGAGTLSERMIIDNSGNVLIGTTSANKRLTVVDRTDAIAMVIGENNVATTEAALRIQARNTGNSSGFNLDIAVDADAPAATFDFGGSERMRIANSGNVGIGTTNPSGTLTIKSGTSALGVDDEAQLTIQTSSTGSGADIGGGIMFLNHDGSGGAFGGSIQCLKENASNNNQANYMRFSTRPNNGNVTERLRIDSAGNVGIGSSPLSRLSIVQSVSSGSLMTIRNTQTRADGVRYGIEFRDSSNEANGTISMEQTGSNNQAEMRFNINNGTGGNGITNGTNAVTFLANGQFFNCTAHPNNGVSGQKPESGGTLVIGLNTTSGKNAVEINNPNGNVGRITSSGSGVTYHTSSDYRLKENETTISDGITRLKTLIPRKFNWKADSTKTLEDGFFAHEVSSVVPEAVDGVKDAIYAEDNLDRGITKGDPIYQMIDHSRLVPLLTAALQEEIAKREALETRIAALEAA